MTLSVHGWVSEEEEAAYEHAVHRCYELSQTIRGDWTKNTEYQSLNAIRNAIGAKAELAKKRAANPAAYDPHIRRMQATRYEDIVPFPTADEITSLRQDGMYGHRPYYSPEFLQDAADTWEYNKRKWLQEKEAYEATAATTSRMPRYGYGFK